MNRYRYGGSIGEIGRQSDIDMNIDMGYGSSIWDTVYRYGYLPYRYGHPRYRYGIWADDMEDDRIDMVILNIDMGYLVTLLAASCPCQRETRQAVSVYEEAPSFRVGPRSRSLYVCFIADSGKPWRAKHY
jgi:hypothetical protein